MLNKKIIQKYNEETATWQYCITEEEDEFILGPSDVCVKISYCVLRKAREICNHITKTDKKLRVPVGREISGVVEAVGDRVTLCVVGDDVVGILPLDAEHSGCGLYCVLSEYDLVRKPEDVTHVDAACVVGDAVKAYTALFYQAKIVSGETIVVVSAATGFGILTAQLALECGLDVIAVGSTDEEINLLHGLDLPASHVLDLRDEKHDLLSVCMRETSGLGVDCFIDSGMDILPEKEMFEEKTAKPRVEKCDVISSLAVGGRWVTSHHGLQLDPPDSTLLTLKCASVHFLFEHSWTLSRGAQGKYLHILSDIMEKMKTRILKPKVYENISFTDCIENVEKLEERVVSGPILVKM